MKLILLFIAVFLAGCLASPAYSQTYAEWWKNQEEEGRKQFSSYLYPAMVDGVYCIVLYNHDYRKQAGISCDWSNERGKNTEIK